MTKKASKAEKIHDLNNVIEDFDYNERQVMVELHIMPDEFDQQEYYRMQEILSAKERKDRMMSPEELLASFGLQREGG
jgi:hypothetical protein